MRRPNRHTYRPPSTQHKRFLLFILLGLSVPLILALIAAGGVALPRLKSSHAANLAVNMDCTLLVPANPLTAQGLASPYQLSATNQGNGPCNEANPNQSAFVQGVIYDPATGAFSVYSPLVIDQGTKPAVDPMVPTLPQEAVVGLWFGFNGNNLTLKGADGNALQQSSCVNGLGGSVFGQFAYCNAAAFFMAANQGIAAGMVKVPALGTGNDGLPCPSVRSFSIVDQDQSDNVQTQYLVKANGRTAQLTAANQAQFHKATVLGNPSDNALVTRVLDPPLGCTAWTAPNLADQNAPVPALPLDELMAAADQQAPVAVIPINDPMVLLNGQPNLQKTNLYRRGVDQPPALSPNQASGATYCQNMIQAGIARLQKDQTLFTHTASPIPAVANSLFTFMASRLQQSFVNLNCQQLLHIPNPVTVQTDGNGIVISATFNTGNGNTNTQNQNTNTATGTNTTPTVGTSTTPTVPATNLTATPTQGTGATSMPNPANSSSTTDPTTGATPTPTVPATSPTASPTTGAGG